MAMTKLSKTQRATLERLAAGDLLRVTGGITDVQAWLYPGQQTVRGTTAAKLIDLGMVAKHGVKTYGSYAGTYHITQSGRDAIGGNNEAE